MIWTVTLVPVSRSTEVESGRVWATSQHHFGPQNWHLQRGGGRDPPPLTASLPSPARPNSPNLKEGQRDAGTEEKRTRTALLYFHTLKTKALWLSAIVRLSLCNLSPCAVGMWHWPQPCCSILRYGYISHQQLRKWSSFKAEYWGLQTSLEQQLAFNVLACHLHKGDLLMPFWKVRYFLHKYCALAQLITEYSYKSDTPSQTPKC